MVITHHWLLLPYFNNNAFEEEKKIDIGLKTSECKLKANVISSNLEYCTIMGVRSCCYTVSEIKI